MIAVTPGPRLTVVFQPQIELPSLLVGGHEVLLRTVGADGAVGAPADLLAMVNAMPRAAQIFHHRRILKFVLAAAKRIVQSTGSRASVNVPPMLLDDSNTMDHLLRTGGAGVTLELLENAAFDASTANDAIEVLAAAGYRIAVDDFGVGFASPAMLLNLRGVYHAKIDRSFLANKTPAGRSVFRALCGVVKARGMKLLVEGVETAEDHEACLDIGADCVQGFWYGCPSSKPLNARRWNAAVAPTAFAARARHRGGAHGSIAMAG